MPIETVSKIKTNKTKSTVYLFDVPSEEDEDALISFIMIVNKDDNIYVERIADLEVFIENIKNCKSTEIDQNSKDYIQFLKILNKYIEENKDDEEVLDELSLISKNFIEDKKRLLELKMGN